MNAVSKLLRALKSSPLSLNLCPVSVWTVGYGATVGCDDQAIDPDMESISETEAEDFLIRDLESSEG